MSDYVDMRFFDVDPAIPHYLVGIEAVFGDAQGVYFATAAVVLRPPIMRIRLRENDIYPAAADASAGAGAFAPIVVPAGYVFDGMGVLVTIIDPGVLSFIERAITVLVKGRRV